MASYREGRLRSIAWEHFEIKDKERGIATCNICHVAFSYRTSVSNLMKHLKNKHGYVVVKGENDDENDEGGEDTEIETGIEKGETKCKEIKTELWEYYQVKDEENKLATCTICLDQFSYRNSTANLYKHLQVKHSVDFNNKGSDDEDQEDDVADEKFLPENSNSTIESRGRKMSSVAWDYFEIKDDRRKVAACNICGALCSYRTSVSNLMKHARRKHGVAGGPDDFEDDGHPEELISQDTTLDDITFKDSKRESSSRSQRSIVWLYFKPVDNESKVSQCLICKKTFSHSSTLTNLKKHLARKHPNVKIPQREDGRKRILLSSGGELYEVETEAALDGDTDANHQNDLMEMDTVYLEDFDLQDDEPLRKPKIKTPKKRKYSSSSEEEEITFINRYVRKPSDSFDHFGKYIASLLRNLPKESSSKLQAEFVRQITSAEKEADKSNACVAPDTESNREFLSDVK